MNLHKRGSNLTIKDLTKSEVLVVLDVVTDTPIGSYPELRGFRDPKGEGAEIFLKFASPLWAESFDRKIRRHDKLVVK